MPRVRITVRRMMVVVLLAGVSCAAFRIYPALGVMAASVSCLSLIRIFAAIDRTRAEGVPMRSAAVVRASLSPVLIALTILVASLLPGLCILPMDDSRQRYTGGERFEAIFIAALLVIPIASLLRRMLW